ncbi:hypothetical protein C1646_755738 [Rhizophagus diaphanus]|nr:hypothetical protein C1646_755738 [Rhizophagus diaphanus] [Rhizophagus sp. MUCL 43196]
MAEVFTLRIIAGEELNTTDNIANISYGKRSDRIIVNLEDSNYFITEQGFEENCNHAKKIDQLQKKLLIAEKAYEKLKIKNKQLNDELRSLQIYNHNLKINKFKRKSDQFNTPKSPLTIVSSSDRYMIKSNPDVVWEPLNKYCHEKFGLEDLIKESTEIVELQ